MREGKENKFIGPIILFFYGFCGGTSRKILRWLIPKFEHGSMYSTTIRKIFKKYHGIDIGYYTYGCFDPYAFQPGTKIGRYSSLYPTVRAFNANHPMNTKSSHAFFFNTNLGYAKHNFLKKTNLTIGNDVFIGHNAIITSTCSKIGDGAVVGAGTLVNRDIPPYAIAVGFPCKIVRYRFSQKTINELSDSEWWNNPIDELVNSFDDFIKPLDGSNTIH